MSGDTTPGFTSCVYRAHHFSGPAGAVRLAIVDRAGVKTLVCHSCGGLETDACHQDAPVGLSEFASVLAASVPSPLSSSSPPDALAALSPLPPFHADLARGLSVEFARRQAFAARWGGEFRPLGDLPPLDRVWQWLLRRWCDPRWAADLAREGIAALAALPPRLASLAALLDPPLPASSLPVLVAGQSPLAPSAPLPALPPLPDEADSRAVWMAAARSLVALPAANAPKAQWVAATRSLRSALAPPAPAPPPAPASPSSLTPGASPGPSPAALLATLSRALPRIESALSTVLLVQASLAGLPDLVAALAAEATVSLGFYAVRTDAANAAARVEDALSTAAAMWAVARQDSAVQVELAGDYPAPRSLASLLAPAFRFPADLRTEVADWPRLAVQWSILSQWAGSAGPRICPAPGSDHARVDALRAWRAEVLASAVAMCRRAFGPPLPGRESESTSSHALFRLWEVGRLPLRVLSAPVASRPVSHDRPPSGSAASPHTVPDPPSVAGAAARMLHSLAAATAAVASCDGRPSLARLPAIDEGLAPPLSAPRSAQPCTVCQAPFVPSDARQRRCSPCSWSARQPPPPQGPPALPPAPSPVSPRPLASSPPARSSGPMFSAVTPAAASRNPRAASQGRAGSRAGRKRPRSRSAGSASRM